MLQRLLHSIFPPPLVPATERERKRFLRRLLVLHFRPPTVPEKTLQLSLSWGLGGMATVLVVLQLASGVLLKFVYEPTPVAAYASVQRTIASVPFGSLVRNLHHWSAHLLVLIVFLHLLRVFFTGAFQKPRQFNWIIGLGLLATVMTANLTGYLLPWDQLAYWAVTVSTGMLEYIPWVGELLQETIRGGGDIGPDTLRIFFAAHTAVVPVVLVVLMGFHFWRIRKAGGLVVPKGPEEEALEPPQRVATLPNLIVREITVAMVLLAAVLLWSVFAAAPLADPANPGLSPNPTKAPWYFAGFQELLLHFHPTFAVFVIPAIFALALLAIPYLDYERDTGGVWFASRIGRRTGRVAALAALVLTPALILVDEWILKPGPLPSSVPSLVASGWIPGVLVLAAVAALYQFARRRMGAGRNEAVQAVFILLVVALVVLTTVGTWFRGPGMRLCWPG